jgi:magnesium transporter
MLFAYKLGPRGLEEIVLDPGEVVPADAAWVDLHQPSFEEDSAAERFLGASIPTREESEEIEYSSRFYAEDGAVFMTASVLTGVDMGTPKLASFTLAVADQKVVTVRYDDLRALRQFVIRAQKPGSACSSAPAVFLGILEAIVDRTADVLERISKDVDRINTEVFAPQGEARQRRLALRGLIERIGAQGDLAAKARESLASLERLAQYAGLALPPAYDKGGNKARMKLVARDVRSLEDHVDFLSNKITFLLDAILGLISVQQNEVISVLTVAATFFFPPTLIGTIYGMNFTFMPELNWAIGYPLVLGLMALSAILPYFYFRRRGWL